MVSLARVSKRAPWPSLCFGGGGWRSRLSGRREGTQRPEEERRSGRRSRRVGRVMGVEWGVSASLGRASRSQAALSAEGRRERRAGGAMRRLPSSTAVPSAQEHRRACLTTSAPFISTTRARTTRPVPAVPALPPHLARPLDPSTRRERSHGSPVHREDRPGQLRDCQRYRSGARRSLATRTCLPDFTRLPRDPPSSRLADRRGLPLRRQGAEGHPQRPSVEAGPAPLQEGPHLGRRPHQDGPSRAVLPCSFAHADLLLHRR